MKIRITIEVKKEKDYEVGDLFYNPKGDYKFVLVGTTIRRAIRSQMWYGCRDNTGSISIVNERVLKMCDYLGKSKGYETLFEVKGK